MSPPSSSAPSLPEQLLDACVKRTFSNREILSHLLHTCIPEFQQFSPQHIREKCLVADASVSSASASADQAHLQPLDIRLADSVDKSQEEGDILLDLVFDVRHPLNSSQHLGLQINLEIQNKDNPGYPLLARGLYYACRLISRQRETLFAGSDYGAIRKVYSIWICPNARPGRANRALLYELDERLLHGEPPEPPIPREDYDRIALMLLGINDRIPAPAGGDSAAFRLLEALMSDVMPWEKRQERLEKEFGFTPSTQKEAHEMKGFAGYYFERGIERGFERGDRQGFERGDRQGFERGDRQGFERGEKKEQIRGMKLLFEILHTETVSAEEAIQMIADKYQTTEAIVRQRLLEAQA